jgi:hypothetical protein
MVTKTDREVLVDRFSSDLKDLISVTEEDGTDFVRQPNYKAWKRALGEIGKEHGYTKDPKFDHTRAYAEDLIRDGADPEHILSVFIMLFG